MKIKNTLCILLATLAIFSFIWFFEKDRPTSPQAKDDAGRVLLFDRDQINQITIKNTGSAIELRRTPTGRWLMEKPVKDWADTLLIAQLFTSAEALKSEGLVNDSKGATKDQIKEYGLANPEIRVTFHNNSQPIELLFGKDSAVDGRIYVRLDKSNAVHVIATDLKSIITKKADEFRDHKLTDLTPNQVTKVEIKSPDGLIELKKKNQDWFLSKPLQVRGNNQKINELISKVVNAQVATFLASSADFTASGIDDPLGTIGIFSDESTPPSILQFGSVTEKAKDKMYLKLSTREDLCVVPKALGALLQVKPNDLRDPQLAHFEPDIVDRISIEGQGSEKIVLARHGESWIRKVANQDQPTNPSAATRLLQQLQTAQISEFISDVPNDLKKYALDQPTAKITLSSFSSENTAETKAGDRSILTLLLGKTDTGQVYAKLQDEPFIVSIPSTLLDLAMTDPLQWQALPIFQMKADEIISFEVIRTGQPSLSLIRNQDQMWSLANRDGKVNQINTQSLVNTLSNLRAVRWLGSPLPTYGLDQPSIVLRFQNKSTGQGTLTIGSATLAGLHPSTAQGKNGVFALSHPDFTAFELPLLDSPPITPASPISPVPSTTPNQGGL